MRNASLSLASLAFAMMFAHPVYADERCSSLGDAASSGDTNEMSRLIASGVGVNCTYTASYVDSDSGETVTYTSTPLIEAAYAARMKPVQRLLSQGANVNIRDGYGHTPLDEVDMALEDMFWDASEREFEEGEEVYRLLENAGARHN